MWKFFITNHAIQHIGFNVIVIFTIGSSRSGKVKERIIRAILSLSQPVGTDIVTRTPQGPYLWQRPTDTVELSGVLNLPLFGDY